MSGGGVTGVRAGEVSGEASVEKGDCLSRMERSSEGLEEQGGGLRIRPFPLREGARELGEDRFRREGGGEDVISSITSMSKEDPRSNTGLTGLSSSSASDWRAFASSSSSFSFIVCSSLPRQPSA